MAATSPSSRASPLAIFDMRGYPRGTAWVTAPRLAAQKVAAARIARPHWAATDLGSHRDIEDKRLTVSLWGKPTWGPNPDNGGWQAMFDREIVGRESA